MSDEGLIIEPETAGYPDQTKPLLAYIKQTWDDEWEYAPDIFPRSARVSTAGEDLGSCDFDRHYGAQLKMPWEAEFAERQPRDISGWWLYLRMYTTSTDWIPFWIGRVSGESRPLEGSQSDGPLGVQQWTAYAPLHLLQKVHVHRSWWVSPDDPPGPAGEVAFLAPFNDLDGKGWRVTERGNRSEDPDPEHECYIFGGDKIWTRKQAVEYVLTMFANPGTGLTWTLGGQTELLEAATDVVRFAEHETVAGMLRKLIEPSMGIDYLLVPTEDGFELRIFSLVGQEASFGSATLPANPDKVTIRTGEINSNTETRVVLTHDHYYKTLRVVGKRLTVCASFKVEDHCSKGWKDEIETTYREDLTDEERDKPEYRNVFTTFFAKRDLDLEEHGARPHVDAAGQFIDDTSAIYQTHVRSTLDITPLREGWSYEDNDRVDLIGMGDDAEFLAPQAFLAKYNTTESRYDYYTAEEVGIAVNSLQNEWGLQLSPSPNHLLAHGHWDDAKRSSTRPVYDYEQTIMTIAFEADQRLTLEQVLTDDPVASGVMEVESDGEFWYLCKDTMISFDADRQPLYSGSTGRVLRTDSERMEAVMAGAIARYQSSRVRAEVRVQKLLPWGELLGQILDVVEDGGDWQQIGGPIASIDWQAENEHSTTVRSGYALPDMS